METDFYSRLAFFLMVLYLIIMRVYFNVMSRRWGKSFSDEGRNKFALRILILLVLIIVSIGYIFNLQFVNIFTLSTLMLLKWTGFIIGGISLLYWTWVQIVLGNLWPANLLYGDARASGLITNGPYKTIRHPLSIAMIFWSFGISILTTNLLFIGFSLCSIILLLLRIPKEEKN